MKKRYIIIPLIVIILIVTIVLLVPKSTKETYAVGDTLAETVKALNAGSSWTSGASGVYYTNSHFRFDDQLWFMAHAMFHMFLDMWNLYPYR